MGLELASPGGHTRIMRRCLLILLLAIGLAPGTWLRTPSPAPNHVQTLAIAVAPLGAGCCQVGVFHLAGAWQLTSPNDDFGGYSALLRLRPGRFFALSDKGNFLDFPAPGRSGRAVLGSFLPHALGRKADRDIEAATFDSASRRLWLALERRNAIERYGAGLAKRTQRQPPEMRDWPTNTGPEAMVRLADGRFIVLSEAYAGTSRDALHPALLFARDPTIPQAALHFTFAGAPDYRPTDIAQLPDGRLLVLMRRLLWPFPARFAGKIILADPDDISAGGRWHGTEVADLAAPLPVDNFEAMTIAPLDNGRLALWLMSDNNDAITQHTLLWRLEFSASDLPGPPARK